MANATTYIRELENLIVNKLLPVYNKYYKEHDMEVPYDKTTDVLLSKIREQKELPALLKRGVRI